MNADVLLPAIDAITQEIARLTLARETLQGLLPAPLVITLDGAEVAARAIARDLAPDAPRRTRVLAATPPEKGARVKEIATAIDEPQSYVHADIQTLEKNGHVEKVARGTYMRTALGEVQIETVWSGATKRSLIDREHGSQAQRERDR